VWEFPPFGGLKLIYVSNDTFTFQQEKAVSLPSAVPVKDIERPKNLIVFIADGMGFAHLSLARAIHDNPASQPVWDRFTTVGWHRPHPNRGFLTDSAASSTALGTGVSTQNGSVGVDAEGKAVTNLFESAGKHGYRTGVVTDSYIWDATPASFVTHSVSRSNAAEILEQMAGSSLEILFGEYNGGDADHIPDRESTIGLLEKRFMMLGADLYGGQKTVDNDNSSRPIAAIFKEEQITDPQSQPTLVKMVKFALERLSSDERPFLLLVESQEPDSASHEQNTIRLARGLKSIEYSLSSILDFAERNEDTLVIFTSDHETGGLVLDNEDGNNQKIRPLWATNGHSGSVVPIMTFGHGSEHFSGTHTNQGIGQLLLSMIQ